MSTPSAPMSASFDAPPRSIAPRLAHRSDNSRPIFSATIVTRESIVSPNHTLSRFKVNNLELYKTQARLTYIGNGDIGYVPKYRVKFIDHTSMPNNRFARSGDSEVNRAKHRRASVKNDATSRLSSVSDMCTCDSEANALAVWDRDVL